MTRAIGTLVIAGWIALAAILRPAPALANDCRPGAFVCSARLDTSQVIDRR